jgi:hypothetical protein
MTVQEDAVAAGRLLFGGKDGAYSDGGSDVAVRDNDIRRWNPTLCAWEWVSDNSVTFCQGFRRAAGDGS